MFVWATRTFSNWFVRGALNLGLFGCVVVVHGAITNALRSAHWAPGTALVTAGAVVLGLVIGGIQLVDVGLGMRAKAREAERLRLGLPDGPCCVIWRTVKGQSDMPWKPVGTLRAPYPAIARRLGVEGFAVVEFEVAADGAAKNIQCFDYWPTRIFSDAAIDALREARFAPKRGVAPRFGASYRMPFVFRISGAAQVADRGRQVGARRPSFSAARRAIGSAVDKLRRLA